MNGWGEVEEGSALKSLQRGCGWGRAKGLYGVHTLLTLSFFLTRRFSLELIIPMEGISCPDLRQCLPLRFVSEACNHFLMPETIQVGSLVFQTFILLNWEKVGNY